MMNKNKNDKNMMPGGVPSLPGLGEPPEVLRRYSRISKKYTGRGPGGPGGPGGPRNARGYGPRKSLDKGTAKRLLKTVFLPNWPVLTIVFIAIIVAAQANVQASKFLQVLIDDYITPMASQANPSFAGLIRAVAQMALIYLAGIICTWLYNFLMVGVAQGTLKKLRDQMFSHMQTLPIKYFDTNSHGDVMSRFTNDTETMRQMIGQSIPQVFSSIVTVVTVFVAMLQMSVWLTLFTLLFVVVIIQITKKIGGRSAMYFSAQQATLGALNGFTEEMINGQKVIKVFNHEDTARDEFDQLNEALYTQAREANKLSNILGPINGNLGHLQYILLAVIGGALAISGVGGLTVGVIAAFLQLSRSFTMPISNVSQQINMVISAMAGAQRIFRLLDEESEPDDGYVTLVNAEISDDGAITEVPQRTGTWAWKHPHKADGTVTYQKLEGDVRLTDVDFAYEEGKTVLHDISIYAEPGQKVAFVGATGAGKTTITNLINRFYDIADGKIRYDGININKIKKADLRRSLGVVLQETNLFTGTVMENIRYGRLDATEDDVYAAARLANADDFIRRLPEGYDTMLTANGANLSQGQRQLIAIARAAVADPPVLILDEATSSIDTRTELLVQRGLDELMKGRTVFVIAHRLSTVQNSDVIMVLDHGRIIERGSHEQLIADRGQYYQLYTGAFELE
jgi:ATP-binding cassette subfamily B multidrug efflux pump